MSRAWWILFLVGCGGAGEPNAPCTVEAACRANTDCCSGICTFGITPLGTCS